MLKKTLKFMGAVAAICTAIGIISAVLSTYWLKIKKIRITPKNLPEGLKGLKILQISDLHNASETSISLNIWSRVLAQHFDIAVITGDMTRKYFEQILPHKQGLCALAQKASTFFVDGNHEYEHFSDMKKFMQGCGIIVLDNKKATLTFKGEHIEILGMRDGVYQRRNNYEPFKTLMEGESETGFKMLLSHQPQIFNRLTQYRDLLVLCGHTHGGQLRLPFCPTLYVPGQGILPKYGAGLYYAHGCHLYISRGIGATEFPIRLFNRPEIGVIELN